MKLLRLLLSILVLALFSSSRLMALDPQINLNTLNKNSVIKLFQDKDIPYPKPLLSYTLETENKIEPIIITVAGLNFGEVGPGILELKHLFDIVNFLFPKKSFNTTLLQAEVDKFNKDYFFSEDDKPVVNNIQTRSMPDNYMEEKLTKEAEILGRDITIISFPWSRDPGDTKETVRQFKEKMIKIHLQYKDTGRPIHILAHSWGTVLMHETLHQLAKSNPEIKINKFITIGSPLMPSNLIVKLFMKLEIRKEDLEKHVSKPLNVRVWKNFWAKRDMYSNFIKSSDVNIQIDSKIENVEPLLINLILHNKLLRKQAKADLWSIRNIKTWHSSYIFDYLAKLNSINKEIFLPVFKPLIIPKTININISNKTSH
jgi:Lecithin:cholesterol acyltransferase